MQTRRLVSILLFSVVGCMTGDSMKNLREGMAKDEVIKILGKPDGFQRSGDDEALRYTNRYTSGWSNDKADYNVILRNGRVVEYGAGEVRTGTQVNTLILVPLK